MSFTCEELERSHALPQKHPDPADSLASGRLRLLDEKGLAGIVDGVGDDEIFMEQLRVDERLSMFLNLSIYLIVKCQIPRLKFPQGILSRCCRCHRRQP